MSSSFARDTSPQFPARKWLSLKDASEVLGIHYTTLRTWADNGEIPVFRTPGGHRRFSTADLRRFLDERSRDASIPDEGALVAAAVNRVREQMQQLPVGQESWIEQSADMIRTAQRERGRQLFSLAIAYVMKPGRRDELAEEGRSLGYAYGQDAAQSHMSLVQTGRAVQFFRNQLVLALHHSAASDGLDADDVRIQQLLNRFLDEVLYAVLEGYEGE
ncbi:MAG: helix-turn-helix domain-containing protein [Caldilineaceae bacterium]|nr:helix-turn-helix domain-containing protein [Caldilineaceae bacterium]